MIKAEAESFLESFFLDYPIYYIYIYTTYIYIYVYIYVHIYFKRCFCEYVNILDINVSSIKDSISRFWRELENRCLFPTYIWLERHKTQSCFGSTFLLWKVDKNDWLCLLPVFFFKFIEFIFKFWSPFLKNTRNFFITF